MRCPALLSRSLLLLLLAVVALVPAWGQARPDCSTRPQTLAEMRGCYRPLLVFAPHDDDSGLAAQRKALDEAADDMMDRFVLLVPITDKPQQVKTPLDAPYALLSAAEAASARRRYGVAAGDFKVLLLGEDGGVKLRSGAPMPVERLNELIDTMPTREAEMRRPHAN